MREFILFKIISANTMYQGMENSDLSFEWSESNNNIPEGERHSLLLGLSVTKICDLIMGPILCGSETNICDLVMSILLGILKLAILLFSLIIPITKHKNLHLPPFPAKSSLK